VSELSAALAKSFVFKILTSNPLGFKILQTHFVNPVPVAGFEGYGGVLISKLPALKPIFLKCRQNFGEILTFDNARTLLLLPGLKAEPQRTQRPRRNSLCPLWLNDLR
jgi:hypothetical protein